MSQELLQFIDSNIRLAQFRGIDPENPIVIDKVVESKVFKISVSLVEPSFNMLPYNVLWIQADPEDENYRKIFRRVGANPPADESTRFSWVELTDMDELFAEEQYYAPIADTSLLNTDIPIVHIPGPASEEAHGTVKTLVTEQEPRAIQDDDETLSDARVPLAHSHDDFARTMLQISTVELIDGDGETYEQPIYVQIDGATPPNAGDVLFVKSQLSDYVYEGEWRKVKEDDVEGGVGPAIVSIELSGQSSVEENTTAQYAAKLIYDDGSEVDPAVPSEFVVSLNPYGVTITSDGELSVPELTANGSVDVTVHYPDEATSKFSDTMAVNVTDSSGGVTPVSLEIIGADEVDETMTSNYLVRVTFSDSSELDVTPDSFVSSNTTAAVIDINGLLTTYEVTQDEETTLTAEYTSNTVTVTGNKTVTIKNAVRAVAILINGPDSIVETGDATFTTTVSFDDSSEQELAPTSFEISAGSEHGTLDGMVFTPNDVDGDQTVTFRATYDDGFSIVSSTHQLSIIDTTVQLELVGADSINETESETYTVLADGSPVDIDSLVALSGGMYVSISSNVVTAVEVTGDKSATIEAAVTVDGQLLRVSKAISIIDTTEYATVLRITGDTEINEGEMSSAYVFDLLDDQDNVLEADIDPDSVTLSDLLSARYSDASKIVTALNVIGDKTVTMNASYKDALNNVLAGTLDFVVRDTIIRPDSITVSTPASANEGTSFVPEVTLHNDNGSTEILAPGTYTLSVNAVTQTTIDQATGTITVNPLDSDVACYVTATYDSSEGELVSGDWINLINSDDAIVDFTISGPSDVYAGQTNNTYEYLTTLTRQSGATEDPAPAESYAIVGTSVVTIDANGILGFTVDEADVISDIAFKVAATNTIEGSPVTKEYDVTLKPMEDASLTFSVVGDSELDESATSEPYKVNVAYGSEWSEQLDVTNIQFVGDTHGGVVVPPDRITAPDNANSEPSVTLDIFYTWKGTTRTIRQNVVFKNTDPTVLESRFTGIPATVTEGDVINPTTIEYRLSDNPGVWVQATTGDVSLSAGANLVTPSGSGTSLRYTVVDGANGTLTLQGNHIYDGTTYSVTAYSFNAETSGGGSMPATPVFGSGPYIHQTAWTEALLVQHLDQAHTDQSGQAFDLDVGWGANDFGWFAHRKSISALAVLTDTGSGFPGGWDGASWEEGGFVGTGPIEVTLDGEQWMIYRMDWPGQGPVNFRVDYT